MPDIVERLRERAAHVDELERGGEQLPQRLVQTLLESADEIERLRAQMESGNYLTTNDKLSLGIERQALEIKALRDEIEWLRTALREIEDSSNDPRAVRQARAALGGKP